MALERTWASFKQVFVDEYHELVEKTKVTSKDAGFHSTNKMQDIGDALGHLAMSAMADKIIVTNTTKAVEAITRNNASLTMQLSNVMKINLDMAKKLNLKDT